MGTLKLIDCIIKADSRIERGIFEAEERAARWHVVIDFLLLAVLVCFIFLLWGGD